MKCTDIEILKVVEERLSGVQHRKEALMKFVNTLEIEEQQLLSLQKTYKDNRPLYDLIEDEPLPPMSTQSDKATSKITMFRVNSESKEYRAREAIMVVLEEKSELTPREIYQYAIDLQEDIDLQAIRNAANRMFYKGLLKRNNMGAYSLPHTGQETGGSV